MKGHTIRRITEFAAAAGDVARRASPGDDVLTRRSVASRARSARSIFRPSEQKPCDLGNLGRTIRDKSERQKRPLRILLLTSEAPPVVSGISTTVGMLQRGLTARGHKVDIVSRADFPRYMRDEIRISAFCLFWPRFYRSLFEYDVVNVHGPVPSISEMFLALSRTVHHSARPAIVYTHHSDLAIPQLERWCSVYNKVANQLAQFADCVVVSSGEYQQRLQRPEGIPVEVIPWAVDAPQDLPPRTARGAGALRILFVGQLRPYKGLKVLLDAVRTLEDVQLSVIGDGPMRAELCERIAMPDLEHVTLCGKVSDADLWRAYSTHDVVVLPSTTTAEAYGLVLVEGMLAGCVPIGSDLPGVRAVAKPTGLVVNPGSAAELRSALVRLRDDRALLQNLSVASSSRAARMTITGLAERYEEVMRSATDFTSDRQASLAVPVSWSGPRDLLEELATQVGVQHASLTLLTRRKDDQRARVWRRDGSSIRGNAPVARYVADLNRPVLINSDEDLEGDLRRLLRRPELTSAILVPIRHTRQTVSVVGLSTASGDRCLLDHDHLRQALAALCPL